MSRNVAALHADSLHPNLDVQNRLARMYAMHRAEMDFRLSRSPYETLLERLGNPHHRLPSVIHVAGTNGKGSVLAFCRAMAEAAGLKCHVYTSPHLLRFNERIVLAGQEISDAQFITFSDAVFAAAHDLELTFFECTTALAFLAMTHIPADVCLLEVGMGGRLDCTNIVPAAKVDIITRISFDHTQYLGDTLAEIAFEKAGIMRAGVPCIIAPQGDDAVCPVFVAEGQRHGANLDMAGQNWRYQSHADGGFSVDGVPYPAPSLRGEHQCQNAATAVRAMQAFGLNDAAIRQGIIAAHWPARLEQITDGKIHASLAKGAELWFDAAHNDSGAASLAVWLKSRRTQGRPITLVVGMGADKDANVFFNALQGAYDHLVLVDLPQARSPQTAKNLAAKLPLGIEFSLAPSIQAAAKGAAPDSIVVVAGSLYLYQLCR